MSPIKTIPSRTTVLNRFHKRVFDVNNAEDLAEYKHFLETGKWRNSVCPFEVEWPYLTIPQMINEKLAEHYLFNVVE